MSQEKPRVSVFPGSKHLGVEGIWNNYLVFYKVIRYRIRGEHDEGRHYWSLTIKEIFCQVTGWSEITEWKIQGLDTKKNQCFTKISQKSHYRSVLKLSTSNKNNSWGGNNLISRVIIWYPQGSVFKTLQTGQ
jgi:hypothetical protein